MNTEKKNQHYIPKFYLKNFSFQKNEKQIGVFNLKNEFFFPTSKLKTQGSKNFFYGYDGVIEDRLSEIEGMLSQAIKNLIHTEILPQKESITHADLLAFVALTDLRNPVSIGNMKALIDQMRDRVLEIHPETQTEKVVPTLSHDEIIEFAMSSFPDIVINIVDLDYKLIINKTKRPFITSDYPVVRYNQFLEEKKWPHSKSGYCLVGLQIFIPLNSEIVLHFFDQNIYKVGNKKQKTLIINDEKSIDEINMLQFVNCFETIFFDHNATEDYIRYLKAKTVKFKPANQPRSELSYIFQEGEDSKQIIDQGKNLIILGSSDCETNLKIEGIKIHSNGKAYKFTSRVTQMRKHPSRMLDYRTRRNSH
ncbi:DUF4238 domain-containing protein [Flavobacterium psychrophilum]|uniref:DUF4238 domain-containing protein n=1 Tax=Flavobacterium psychrophilum TaxID=96345 RepID=UPI00106C9193|nr:DUF4238 domain-containing protein [Flavobacterium psychrophilum]